MAFLPHFARQAAKDSWLTTTRFRGGWQVGFFAASDRFQNGEAGSGESETAEMSKYGADIDPPTLNPVMPALVTFVRTR
jgi:hypothetical protein